MMEDHTPAAQQVEQLRAMEAKAHALLVEMAGLSPGTSSTFLAHWDALAFDAAFPELLSDLGASMRGEEGRFLGAVWDMVSDLQTSARYTAEQITPSRQTRPSQLHARYLVQHISDQFERLTGSPPPFSKETWFPLFMERLCAWPRLGLACGRALVESALKAKHRD